jgi:serine/threonine-protein phosphatase 2A regulatory subunit B''
VLYLQGYLTIADLYTFFREIHALWVNMGEYAELEIYDVLDEIMDMVKPATPGRITKADLAACKMSGTVFSILANVDQFYTYNFRCGMWAS